MSESSTLNHVQQTLAIHHYPQISFLKEFVKKILDCQNLLQKEDLLDAQGKVSFFFLRHPSFYDFSAKSPLIDRIIIKSLILIDQAEFLFQAEERTLLSEEKIKGIISDLFDVETFYKNIGGIIGYQLKCLELIAAKQDPGSLNLDVCFSPPKGFDIRKKTTDVDKTVLHGIRGFKKLAELFPVGGAADRLNLQDEKTHVDLPAARLEFLGRSLLEGIIRDVQAKEYLYYKVYKEQITIPLALMTSLEKNNHQLIVEIIEENKFFGRDPKSFKLFSQPLVPTINEKGGWVLKEPFKLLLKPGGHGVIWKLAYDHGVFEWFYKQGKEYLLVRQINNPIAGVDHGLAALIGYGVKHQKALGFASCPRRVKTSEGLNIVKSIKNQSQETLTLSCIEYCDFEKFGIEDLPVSEVEPFSIFPSNTNIIFGNLKDVEMALVKNPMPGELINFKMMQALNEERKPGLVSVARLELLMQNLADVFSINGQGLEPDSDLPVFVTFNARNKTISPTKKEFVPGSGLVETAFGCFYDYLSNCRDLLQNYCHFVIPEVPSEEEFLKRGPSFILNYHPSLGPLYTVIAQKIKKGAFAFGSELQLEIADVEIEDLDLEGSLIVDAKNIQGHLASHQWVHSDFTGRCLFKNVKIRNKGILHHEDNIYWKNQIEREETCYIQLLGYSEFIAENVTLDGDFHVIVKEGERVIAMPEGDHVIFKKEPLDRKNCQPFWNYTIKDDEHLILTR